MFSINIDVMGIVRDRQVPCTCETYNGQIGPSSDYSKESSENVSESSGPNPHQRQDSSYSQSNEQSQMPFSQGERMSHQLQAQEPTYASGTPQYGHLVYSQQGGQSNDASEKPAEPVSSEYHMSDTNSLNGHHTQNNIVYSGEFSHEQRLLSTQRQPPRISEGRHDAVQDDKSREDEENSIGTEDYPTDSEESRKYDNGGHDERLKNDSYGNRQEHIQGSEAHPFAAGFPEHYQPHVSIYAGDASGEKPLSQQTSREHQNSEGDDTSQGTHSSKGGSFQSSTYSHERVQGSGSSAQPSFIPSQIENKYGRPQGQGELTSEYKVPSKVVAVGHATENHNTGAQEQDRHGKS